MTFKSEAVYDAGYAIGSVDNKDGTFIFRFRNEDFSLRKMQLSEGRPNRLVPTMYMSEMPKFGFKYGILARIDDIREAMKYEDAPRQG